MAEQMNGDIKPDVEMKEEGAELSVDPVQAVPPFQPEPQAAAGAVQTGVNGIHPQGDGPMASGAPHPSQDFPSIQPTLEQAQLQPQSAPYVPVAEAPAASPLPAAVAPVAALPVAQAQTSASALTPVARESSRPSSIPPAGIAPPERPNAHGSPTRVYLNQNVTPHLLEGMKYLAAYEPEKPLKWLSEFLAKRSAETEGEA